MRVPLIEPLSAVNPQAAGVLYVPLVIPVPSEEIVAVPVDVPVPREPASVNVNESWVSFEIVAWTESSPNEPLSHSPPNAVNAPGDPWMRMTLDLSATTVAPVCVKFVSTNTLLVGFTAECANHLPLTLDTDGRRGRWSWCSHRSADRTAAASSNEVHRE